MVGDVLRRGAGRRGRSSGGMVRLLAHTDPVALTGIALSVLLSITLDLTNLATGVESLLAGLMGITISLLVDSLARGERRFQLRTLLEGPPWLAQATPPVVAALRTAAEAHAGTRVAAEARRRFEEFRQEAEQLAAGRISRPGDDDEDLLGATRDCVRRLDAVTNVVPRTGGELAWWRGEIGRRYWDANVAALARGVAVTRIFVYVNPSEELSRLVAEQRRAGVRVGLLQVGVVGPRWHGNLAVWDGTSCWEARMSPYGEVTEHIFSVCPPDVERLSRAFDRCAAAATYQDG